MEYPIKIEHIKEYFSHFSFPINDVWSFAWNLKVCGSLHSIKIGFQEKSDT